MATYVNLPHLSNNPCKHVICHMSFFSFSGNANFYFSVVYRFFPFLFFSFRTVLELMALEIYCCSSAPLIKGLLINFNCPK